ncbi:MAG TPA: transglycosylase domain-containing protein [Acidimicrobiales bacterium]
MTPRRGRAPSSKPGDKAKGRAKQSKASPPADGARGGFLWRWRRVFFAAGLLIVLGIVGVAYLFTQVPLPDKDPPLLQTTYVCADDVTSGCNADNAMAQLSGGVDRVTVTRDQIPPILVDAVVSAEDRGFFKHGGIDPVGVGRALWADLRNSGVQQGGSTITQQYVKNTYLTDERTVTRKVKEAVLAVKLERELPKSEILTRYLNTIYFGRGAYGVQAASKTYFGKNVEDLNLGQAAFLAGLIRSPETADPNRGSTDPSAATSLQTATRRRDSVLDAMLQEHYITQEQRDYVAKSGFDDVLPRQQSTSGRLAHPELGTGYIVDYVQYWLRQSGQFTDAEMQGGGLRIYTSIDYEWQQDAIDAVTSTLNQPNDPSAAVVAVDTQGHIKTMVGGLDYAKSQVNLAVGADGGGGGRQAGSTFKAFAVTEALKQGMGLGKTYNSPATITIPGADAGHDWKPSNDDNQGYGTINMVRATQDSVNTYFAQLVEDINPQNLVATANRMGVDSPLEPNASLVLGTSPVSPLDMASGYSTLMDNGEHVTPTIVTRVTDASGRVLYEPPAKRNRVVSQDITDQVSWALSQVILGGTGTGANFGKPAAGKTGTTEDFKDAWFVGYTCQLTTAVWMGYPGEPAVPGQAAKPVKAMTSVHGRKVFGGTFAAPIWSKFMAKATKDLDSCPFNRPTNVTAGVSPGTGVPGTAPRSSTTSTATPASSTTTSSTAPETTTTAPTTTTTTKPTTTTTALAGPKPP